MNNVILHIGLHKTGSTYLQKFFFPNLSETIFIDSSESFIEQWDSQVYKESKNILFSNERFSGRPWIKPYSYSVPVKADWLKSFEMNIIALKKYYPNAIIIIFFRQHGDLLLSLYRQYIQEGGVLKLSDFYGTGKLIEPDEVCFKKRIEILEANFQKVYLLDFTDFKNSGDNYLVKMFEQELNICIKSKPKITNKQNPGIKGKGLEICRELNIGYNSLPTMMKKGLKKLGLHPRQLVQYRFKFLNTDDYEDQVRFKENINNEFLDDWLYFQNVKYAG